MAERGLRRSHIEAAKRIDIEHASLIQDAIKASTPALRERSSWAIAYRETRDGIRKRFRGENPKSLGINSNNHKGRHVLSIAGKEIRIGYKPLWIDNSRFKLHGQNPVETLFRGDAYGVSIKSVHDEKPRRLGGVRLNIEHVYRKSGDFVTEPGDKTREATAAILYSLAEDQGKLSRAIISRAEDLHAATVTKDTAGPGREYIFVPDETSQKIIRVDQAFRDESNDAKIAEAKDLLANEQVQELLRNVSSQAATIEITERDGNRVVKIGEREVTIPAVTTQESSAAEEAPIHHELLRPLTEAEAAKRGWSVTVAPDARHVRAEQTRMGIVVEIGMTEGGYDSLALKEAGGGGSIIIPYLEMNGELYVGVVEEDRPNLGGKILNVPRGFLDPGETHFQTAKRELSEEAGYRPMDDRIISVGGDPMNPNSTFFVTKEAGEGVKPFAVAVRSDEVIALQQSDDPRQCTFTFNTEVIEGVSGAGKKVMKSRFIHWSEAMGLQDMFTVAAVGRLRAQIVDKVL